MQNKKIIDLDDTNTINIVNMLQLVYNAMLNEVGEVDPYTEDNTNINFYDVVKYYNEEALEQDFNEEFYNLIVSYLRSLFNSGDYTEFSNTINIISNAVGYNVEFTNNHKTILKDFIKNYAYTLTSVLYKLPKWAINTMEDRFNLDNDDLKQKTSIFKLLATLTQLDTIKQVQCNAILISLL